MERQNQGQHNDQHRVRFNDRNQHDNSFVSFPAICRKPNHFKFVKLDMARQLSKTKKIIDIVLKHWRKTIGSLMILVSVFLLIFKKISVETLASIIAALIAAGYLPKSNNDENK